MRSNALALLLALGASSTTVPSVVRPVAGARPGFKGFQGEVRTPLRVRAERGSEAEFPRARSSKPSSQKSHQQSSSFPAESPGRKLARIWQSESFPSLPRYRKLLSSLPVGCDKPQLSALETTNASQATTDRQNDGHSWHLSAMFTNSPSRAASALFFFCCFFSRSKGPPRARASTPDARRIRWGRWWEIPRGILVTKSDPLPSSESQIPGYPVRKRVGGWNSRSSVVNQVKSTTLPL